MHNPSPASSAIAAKGCAADDAGLISSREHERHALQLWLWLVQVSTLRTDEQQHIGRWWRPLDRDLRIQGP